MNANEISPKAEYRLNRIKIVSRIVRVPMFAMFLYLAFFGIFQVGHGGSGFFRFLTVCSTIFPTANHPTEIPTYIFSLAWIDDLIDAPGITIISAIGFWKLAKLFHLYERGMIFTSETVRCIKFLGWLCAVQWMLQVIHHFLYANYLAPWFQSTLPPKFAAHLRDMSFTNPLFFSFPIGNINFGLLLAGIVIVLIAWVMDEGRKIQEEQALTV